MLYFRYHNTHCYFIPGSSPDKLLAVDAGWPNTLREYARSLKQLGFRFDQITWAIVTHFHLDHAGLISEFVDRGILCYVFERQIEAIDAMEKTILKNDKRYRPIDKSKLNRVLTADSSRLFRNMGIHGEVIPTGCHSPDSITFLSDKQEAIIGDMPPIDQIMPDDQKCAGNWKMLADRGVQSIYPSHAQPFQLIR